MSPGPTQGRHGPPGSVAGNVGWMAASVIVTRAANVVFYLFLARSAGVEPFGTFVFALGFAAAFAVLVDWGCNDLVVREVAKDRRLAERYLTNGLLWKVLLLVAALAGIIGSMQLLDYPAAVRKAVYLATGFFLAASFETFFFAVFRAFERLKYEAILTSARDLSLPVVGGLLLLHGAGIMEVLLAYSLIGMISSLITVAVVTTRFVPVSTRALDARFTVHFLGLAAFPFALSNVLLILYAKQGILVLQHLRGATEVGWYAAADKLIDAAMIIPHIVTTALYPAFSRISVTSRPDLDEAVSSACRGMLVVGLWIAVCTTFFLAEPLVRLLYGRDYEPAVWLLQWLSWSLPFFFTTRVIFSFWAAIGALGRMNVALALAVALAIGGNIVAVPRFGMMAVAVLSAASAALLCLVSLVVLSRQITLQRLVNSALGTVAGTVLSATLAVALRGLAVPWGINMLVTTVGYAVVLYRFQVVSKTECRMWYAKLRRQGLQAASARPRWSQDT